MVRSDLKFLLELWTRSDIWCDFLNGVSDRLKACIYTLQHTTEKRVDFHLSSGTVPHDHSARAAETNVLGHERAVIAELHLHACAKVSVPSHNA